MSKKGGYVIVDLKGQSITAGTPFTLDGVTARLDRAKNKACLLSGFAIGNDEKRDVFVDLQPTADGYEGTIDGYQITIEDDSVTFTATSNVKLPLKYVIQVNDTSTINAGSSHDVSFDLTDAQKAQIDTYFGKGVAKSVIITSVEHFGAPIPSGIIVARYIGTCSVVPPQTSTYTIKATLYNTKSEAVILNNTLACAVIIMQVAQ